MNKEDFRKIESVEEFNELLQEHGLFREDDVTFESLDHGELYVFTGDGFEIDAELFEELEIAGLLVEGSVQMDYLSVSDLLPDLGVFCITGSVRCKDMMYATESTGMVVGGDLVIENLFYADCGNSVLQVNGDLTAKLLFNSQCSVEVRGKETTEYDESISAEQLAAIGLTVDQGGDPGDAVRSYFSKYDE